MTSYTACSISSSNNTAGRHTSMGVVLMKMRGACVKLSSCGSRKCWSGMVQGALDPGLLGWSLLLFPSLSSPPPFSFLPFPFCFFARPLFFSLLASPPCLFSSPHRIPYQFSIAIPYRDLCTFYSILCTWNYYNTSKRTVSVQCFQLRKKLL